MADRLTDEKVRAMLDRWSRGGPGSVLRQRWDERASVAPDLAVDLLDARARLAEAEAERDSRGVEEERARVVAWLRGSHYDPTGIAADAIERGAHEEGEEERAGVVVLDLYWSHAEGEE